MIKDGNDSDNNRVLLDDLLTTMTKNLKNPQRLGSDHSQNEWHYLRFL